MFSEEKAQENRALSGGGSSAVLFCKLCCKKPGTSRSRRAHDHLNLDRSALNIACSVIRNSFIVTTTTTYRRSGARICTSRTTTNHGLQGRVRDISRGSRNGVKNGAGFPRHLHLFRRVDCANRSGFDSSRSRCGIFACDSLILSAVIVVFSTATQSVLIALGSLSGHGKHSS